jgi:hypothetical protein
MPKDVRSWISEVSKRWSISRRTPAGAAVMKAKGMEQDQKTPDMSCIATLLVKPRLILRVLDFGP